MLSIPASRVALDDLDQLGAGVARAREVRHRRHRGVVEDLHDEVVGALTRGAAGAVGDRHVRRAERFELDERARERRFHLLGRAAARTRTRSSGPCCRISLIFKRISVRDTVGDAARDVLAHHPRRRRLRGHGYFKRLGPGIVTGAADDDPSGIGTYSQVGAAFGFGLVWSALYVAPLAAAVQEMAARLGL